MKSKFENMTEIMKYLGEKEICLYDYDVAGQTCQKVLVNGIETTADKFKAERFKRPLKAKGHNWIKKRHSFIPD